MIPVMHIILSVFFAVFGGTIGYLAGRRVGQLHFYKTALKIKNPEMWDLLHFYIVDEEEDRAVREREREGKREHHRPHSRK